MSGSLSQSTSRHLVDKATLEATRQMPQDVQDDVPALNSDPNRPDSQQQGLAHSLL